MLKATTPANYSLNLTIRPVTVRACARPAPLREVIEMLLEDGEPERQSEFVDVRTIQVA